MIRSSLSVLIIFVLAALAVACVGESEQEAEVDDAEVDDAEVDDAEVDDAEVDDAEVDDAEDGNSGFLKINRPEVKGMGGVICGKTMCCSTAPSGGCWPKPKQPQ